METNDKNGNARGSDAAKKMDLTDSPHDQQRLLGDEAIIELPDVKDIPGQEFVQAPPLGMMADTTISSADEEGEGLFDDDATAEDELFNKGESLTDEEREAMRTGDGK